MLFTFCHEGIFYEFDSAFALDISIPLRNGNNNPNCYYADPVKFETIRSGNFIGDVSEGGVVNHKKVSFTPHGNGTHTECYGHISEDKEGTLLHCLHDFLFVSHLISVSPRTIGSDTIITLSDVQERISSFKAEAIILRSLPNSLSKMSKKYSGTNPVYIEPAVGKYLADSQVKHLIVDLPSVDKEVDNGLLLTHKAFWQYPFHIRKNCTITELAFIPDTVRDGIYLLNLQISSFDLDVSPSKPILYMLKKQFNQG